MALLPGIANAQRGSYAHVSARSGHGMVIKNDGTLWAFGQNDNGQLGDGSIIDSNTPIKVLSNVASVACGNNYTMAVLKDGTL